MVCMWLVAAESLKEKGKRASVSVKENRLNTSAITFYINLSTITNLHMEGMLIIKQVQLFKSVWKQGYSIFGVLTCYF